MAGWRSSQKKTFLGAVTPILRGTGDVADPHVESISPRLGLVVGDLGLARFEAKLSQAWPGCMDRDEAAFRAISSFYRVIRRAAELRNAELVLIDVGPNLGAINRSALLAANYVVVPLAADLFSLHGLKNLGPNLREWRQEWSDRLNRRPTDPSLKLPPAEMQPAGYVVLQHAVRLDLNHFLADRRDALIICDLADGRDSNARVVGLVEGQQGVALKFIIESGTADAPTLGRHFDADGERRPTKWNNTLVALEKRGLVAENAVGRLKVYSRLIEGMTYGN